MNPLYSVIRNDARELHGVTRVDHNCAPIALTAVTDEPYDLIEYACEELAGFRVHRIGNQARGRWNKMHPNCGWKGLWLVLKELGFSYTKLPSDEWPGKTPTTFERGADKNKRYLLRIKNGAHIIAVVDGEVADWTAGRKHHINAVWEVTKN